MYSYDPNSGRIVCVSCSPQGNPPTGPAQASRHGIFLSNDGRVFFYSPDALVPQDTDKLRDVYEFVDGRPQLITSGIGSADEQKTPNQVRPAGLEGVSSNGVDVYFSTYDTLVPQDHNGQFMKFYDARSGGGFSFVPPPAPCAAADECHGSGNSPPQEPTIVSEGNLGSRGNLTRHQGSRKKKKHRRGQGHRHRATGRHG
jgi:hypothetical protein